MSKLVAFILPILFCVSAQAREPWKSEYDSLSDKNTRIVTGETYRVDLSELRPTQFAVGRAEIRSRLKEIREMGKSEFRRYLKRKVGDAVIGPEGDIYLVDGHHLASALLQNSEEEMLVKVTANLSRLSRKSFFDRMVATHRMWLYDENGEGPLPPEELPRQLRGLRDDPYRSFAYKIRKAGGFRELALPFQEFIWANFFRSRISLDELRRRPLRMLSKGLEIAHSPEASSMPGYSKRRENCVRLLTNQ